MHFYSTNHKSPNVFFKKAVLQGMPNDGGLYMPERVPEMPEEFFGNINTLSFQEISFRVAKTLLGDDLSESVLQEIIEDAINFDAPLVPLTENISTLELFHGPTLAFKDFGARFMARLFSYFVKNDNRELTILVATSGDTGSAVAHGFYRVPGVRVVILYPANKVSRIQEQQFTTLGENITALEIDGTFDDCQRLVKAAFTDRNLNEQLQLTSANSINIARLIPQTFYYFYGYAQLHGKSNSVVLSVPSGNYGNLTAGLIAKKMGLPIHQFLAASNANDIIPEYLQSGKFNPRPSVETISNAMDVGDPSNFARILELYKNDLSVIRGDIFGASFTDDETRDAIQEVDSKYNYTMDPHGAVGFLALRNYLESQDQKFSGIFLETAHPAKFLEHVQPLVNHKVEIPERLEASLEKAKKSIPMEASLEDLKAFLLH